MMNNIADYVPASPAYFLLAILHLDLLMSSNIHSSIQLSPERYVQVAQEVVLYMDLEVVFLSKVRICSRLSLIYM